MPTPTETVPPTEAEPAAAPTPDDIGQELKRAEKKEFGEQEQLAGLAKGLVELLYTFPNQEKRFDFANPTLQKAFADLAERSKTSLPEAAANWPHVIKDLEQLFTDRPDFLHGFPKEKQAGYREAEKEVLTALAILMLRGTMTTELLSLITEGGIVYQTEKVSADDHADIDDVGHFVTKDRDGKTRIYLYPRAFQKFPPEPDGRRSTEEIDTETVVTHELAHGLLRHAGLAAQESDLIKLIKDPSTNEATPSLFGIERTLLQEMFLRPDQAAPWTSRYVSELLGKLTQNPADEKLRAHLVQEYQAEALQFYLRSSGRPADYLQKRLEATKFYADFRNQSPSTNQPVDPQIGKLFKEWSARLTTTDVHQSAAMQQLLSQVDQFVTQSLTDPRFDDEKKGHLKNLLLETAVTHSRYQQLRGRENLKQIAAKIAGKQAGVFSGDLLGSYSSDRVGTSGWGSGGGGEKQPGFWQLVLQALAELPGALRG